MSIEIYIKVRVAATELARRTRLESCPKPHPTCAIHRIIVYYCPKEHDKRRIESTVQRLGKRPYRADHFDHEHRQVRSGHLCIRQRLAQPPKAGVSVPGRDRRRERPRNRRDRRHPEKCGRYPHRWEYSTATVPDRRKGFDGRRRYRDGQGRANVTSFDSSPCLSATIDDLDLGLFKHYFLPKAMTDEELDAESRENRDIKQQLSVFVFFDTLHDCPTNAAKLFFAKNLRKFIPGAYIQYVRFAGKDRSGDILTEHEFKANLCTTLPELDTFIKTTIANRRPIPVSALREVQVVDYPDWATRELLMNAICHRDYSTNGPIQFYQYDDRIEIMNHGGLYGRANESNFPNVNDYRNIVVAEAMKALGFVNRHSRGVLRVQKELKANENGEAVYDFGYQTAILVRENKSPLGERMMAEAIVNGYLTESSENSAKTAFSKKNVKKTVKFEGFRFSVTNCRRCL